MICAPAGMAPFDVTLRILSSSTMTTALAMLRWPSHNLPNLIALVAAPAWAAKAAASARASAAIRNMSPSGFNSGGPNNTPLPPFGHPASSAGQALPPQGGKEKRKKRKQITPHPARQERAYARGAPPSPARGEGISLRGGGAGGVFGIGRQAAQFFGIA